MTSLTDLRRVAEEAFPMNIDSAATIMDREIDCPICGDGTVETRLFENFDNSPVSVEVYGIGDALTKTEAFLRLVNPATVLSLLDRIEKAEADLARAHALLREANSALNSNFPRSVFAGLDERIRAELLAQQPLDNLPAGETK